MEKNIFELVLGVDSKTKAPGQTHMLINSVVGRRIVYFRTIKLNDAFFIACISMENSPLWGQKDRLDRTRVKRAIRDYSKYRN